LYARRYRSSSPVSISRSFPPLTFPISGKLSEEETIVSEDHNKTFTETVLLEAFVAGLDDERMADVTLLGRNCAQGRAIKFVLGSRSEALRQKLNEDPDQSSRIFLGSYGEAALRHLKDYCYTGQLRSSDFRACQSSESSRTLVELASIAKYTDLKTYTVK
jgi:hypothetical protein